MKQLDQIIISQQLVRIANVASWSVLKSNGPVAYKWLVISNQYLWACGLWMRPISPRNKTLEPKEQSKQNPSKSPELSLRPSSSSAMAAAAALRNPDSRRLLLSSSYAASYYHSCCRGAISSVEPSRTLLSGVNGGTALESPHLWRRFMATFTRTYVLFSIVRIYVLLFLCDLFFFFHSILIHAQLSLCFFVYMIRFSCRCRVVSYFDVNISACDSKMRFLIL